jgi:hypothetical protein
MYINLLNKSPGIISLGQFFIRDFDYEGDAYEFELGSIAVDGSPDLDLRRTTTFHVKQSKK